jgi:hypothetical protein
MSTSLRTFFRLKFSHSILGTSCGCERITREIGYSRCHGEQSLVIPDNALGTLFTFIASDFQVSYCHLVPSEGNTDCSETSNVVGNLLLMASSQQRNK